jgi:hypothetical protein
MTATRDRFF